MSLTVSPGEIDSEVWGGRTEQEVKYVVLPDSGEEQQYETAYIHGGLASGLLGMLIWVMNNSS